MENTEQPTILLVDDALENLKGLIAFLEESGFRMVIARSGEAALKRAAHILPDIILLDVLMPDMDGFETCRRFKKHDDTRDIPVIFLTALFETVDKVQGFEVGGVDFLTKPVQHEEVLARVNVHLTIRKLYQQLQQEYDRFQSLAEATLEGIIIYEEKCILETNHVIMKMFGYSRSELIGKDILELLTPASHDIVSEHLCSEDEPPHEGEGITKDGAIFPVEMQVRAMSWQKHNVRVAAIHDITWRKAIKEERNHLQKENITLRSGIQDRYKFEKIIGKSHVMQEVYEQIVSAAASDANVAIYGGSGTGKELVARTIHQLSERKDQAFVPVNCGAVPEPLFEREFFGHRKGTFTGATMDKAGYFDRAHGGTLFLDEIGELNQSMQVKLLRVLQDGEYTPLGDTKSKTADVRIIAATNKDLKDLLRQGVIREDFFYRIRVIVIDLPLLRERKEDIPLLIEHFLEQYGKDEERPMIPGHILEALCAYDWPGNVRELQNELQRYLAEQRLEFLGNVQLEPFEQRGIPGMGFELERVSFREAVESFEKRLIARALAQNAGHQGNTAKMLDIPQKTLYNKIKKYGLKNGKD